MFDDDQHPLSSSSILSHRTPLRFRPHFLQISLVDNILLRLSKYPHLLTAHCHTGSKSRTGT
jgi:hypothetical protein